jgi:hypothetical protein
MKYAYLYERLNERDRKCHTWTYNKKQAAKWLGLFGGRVYRISYGYLKDCHFVMDAPTVKVVGELIMGKEL